jgi:hypothetical protein
MNARKITFQAPVEIPEAPKVGAQHLYVLSDESGFHLKWVPLIECPLLERAKTGEKMHKTMSLTSDISHLPQHGKVVLSFEDILVSHDGRKIYRSWDPAEWIECDQ